MAAATNRANDSTRVILEKPTSTLILYSAIVVDEKNNVFFFDDVFGYDKQLDEALKKGTHI